MSGILRTHLLPPSDPSCFGPDGIAVVADILRATSVMVAALHAGAVAVYPCLEIDEASALARSLPNSLTCGERYGLPIEGFELGNSPGDYDELRCRGRELVMTTTNGTRALLSSVACRSVYPLAFTNLTTVFETIVGQKRPIHLICAGTDGEVSWEDTLACGMLARALLTAGHLPADDSTLIAAASFENELGGFDPTSHHFRLALVDVLKRGRGGKRVRAIGLEKDIVEVARFDDFDILCQVVADPWRVVVTSRIG